MRYRARYASRLLAVATALGAVIAPRVMAVEPACETGRFSSTFELVQAAIFDRHGCTNSVCHGAAPGAGGLDLRADVAYDNLIDVAALTPLVQALLRDPHAPRGDRSARDEALSRAYGPADGASADRAAAVVGSLARERSVSERR